MTENEKEIDKIKTIYQENLNISENTAKRFAAQALALRKNMLLRTQQKQEQQDKKD